jgi:hypothetical protein
MSHFSRTRSDWFDGYAPTGADFDDLDGKTVKALDGKSGGTYSPSSAIVIGGAGLQMVGATLALNAAIVVQPGAGKVLEFGNNDYPKYDPVPYASKFTVSAQIGLISSNIGDVSRTGLASIDIDNLGAVGRVPLRVHDNSLITVANFHFIIIGSARIPSQLPRFRVVRVDATGLVEPLRQAFDVDQDGWISMVTPVSGAAYINGNSTQFTQYPCNINNTVDSSKYLYIAEFMEESGANSVAARLNLGAIEVGYQSVFDARPQ